MHQPIIRPARLIDAAALSELATRTWSDAFAGSVSPDDAALLLDDTRSEDYFIRSLRENTILVVEDNDSIVGYVQFGEVHISEIEANHTDKAIHRLYVDAPLQGEGLGRRLMEAALQHPGLMDATQVFLSVWEKNARAISLYESLGFRKVGTTKFYIGSELVEDLVFVLEKTVGSQRPSHDHARS